MGKGQSGVDELDAVDEADIKQLWTPEWLTGELKVRDSPRSTPIPHLVPTGNDPAEMRPKKLNITVKN